MKPAESLTNKVADGFKWQLCTLASQIILNLIFLGILSRIVEPSEFGKLAVLRTLLTFFEIFTELGFGAALIQKTNLNNFHVSSVLYISVSLSFLMYLLLCLLASSISGFYNSIFSNEIFYVFLTIIVIKSFAVVPRSLMIKDFEFRKIFFSTTLSVALGNLLVGIPLAFNGLGVWALVLAIVSTNLIAIIILQVLKPHSFSLAYSRLELVDVVSFGTKLSVIRVLNHIATQSDKLILGKFVDTSTFGLYERSQFISNLPKAMLGGASSNVAFSLFAKIKENPAKTKSIFQSYILLISIVMLFLCQFVFSNSVEILRILLGPNWVEGAIFLKVLSVHAFLHAYSRFSDPLIRAHNAMHKVIPIKFLFAMAIIFTLLISVSHFEVTAIILLLTIPVLFHSMSILYVSFRVAGITISDIQGWVRIVFLCIIYVLLKSLLIGNFEFLVNSKSDAFIKFVIFSVLDIIVFLWAGLYLIKYLDKDFERWLSHYWSKFRKI